MSQYAIISAFVRRIDTTLVSGISETVAAAELLALVERDTQLSERRITGFWFTSKDGESYVNVDPCELTEEAILQQVRLGRFVLLEIGIEAQPGYSEEFWIVPLAENGELVLPILLTMMESTVEVED